MGLRPARPATTMQTPERDFAADWRRRRWLLPASLAAMALAAEALGETGRLSFRYARSAIADGEAWRLVTGHLVHLGWSHFLMNLLALAAIWALVGRHLAALRWWAVLGIVVAGIDAGFWWLEPRLEWYVGLSGVLHGLLVAGLAAAPRDARGEALLLLGLVAAKLAWEQVFGALPGSAAAAGGPVVVEAHLYGAIAGAAAVACLRIRVGRAASI